MEGYASSSFCFRDYQYQWIYHFLQGAASRQPLATHIFYGGIQYTRPAFRVGKMAIIMVHNVLDRVHGVHGCYVGTLVRRDEYAWNRARKTCSISGDIQAVPILLQS